MLFPLHMEYSILLLVGQQALDKIHPGRHHQPTSSSQKRDAQMGAEGISRSTHKESAARKWHFPTQIIPRFYDFTAQAVMAIHGR